MVKENANGYIYITVYVRPAHIAALRRLREATGKSKSALVREALDLLIRRYRATLEGKEGEHGKAHPSR